MRNNAGKFLVLFLLVALVVDGMAFVACKVMTRAGVMYRPLPTAGYAAYLAERDPVLGWPAPSSRGRGEIDASGSRVVPAFPDPTAPSCVALFGDSFTFGDEVTPAEAYGNVLAEQLHCRVSNFGVGGYGTDQAVLRYELLKPDAGVVVLGHMTNDIIRNVNQERGFLNNEPLGLKPRFLLRNGALDLIALPNLTEEEYAGLEKDAGRLLPDDYFYPGGPSGLAGAHFPFLLSAIHALGHYRIKASLHHEPSYAQFYRPDHPSGALQVTEAIVKRFVADAGARHQKPLVLLIPDYKDLEWLDAHGAVPYQPLVDLLAADGISAVSAADALHAYLGGKAPCTIYRCKEGNHLTPDGYRQLALLVEHTIRDRALLASAPAPAR